MSFDFTYPTPLPSTKNWGPGWPNCDQRNIVPHPVFQGGVHRNVLELTNILVEAITDRGYVFHAGWSWGYGCRATKGGSGTTPSFHSWGLALDFNAPENVFGGNEASSDIATNNRWIVGLMHDYGWFWLGPPIGDWMHFSFCGSPADAAVMTQKAREELMKDSRVDDLLAGMTDYLQGTPPNDGAPISEKRIYKSLNDAASKPRPDATSGITKAVADGLYAPIAHEHNVKGTTTG